MPQYNTSGVPMPVPADAESNGGATADPLAAGVSYSVPAGETLTIAAMQSMDAKTELLCRGTLAVAGVVYVG